MVNTSLSTSCGDAWVQCYTEKASPTRHRPERQHNARSNRRKQCSPNETKPYSKPTPPRQKANYSYKWSHPTPHEADAHTSHAHKNAPSRTQSPGGRPPSTCTHRTSQPAEVADATTIMTPPASCQLTGPTAPLPINQKAKCLSVWVQCTMHARWFRTG